MLVPDLKKFEELAKKGNIVPVYREVLADLDTPVSALLKFAAAGADHLFLLESVEGGEKWARYSFLSADPALVFRARGTTVRIMEYGSWSDSMAVRDPVEYLASIMRRFRPVEIPGLPRFFGGAVGYLAYDVVRFFEELPDLCVDDLRADDMVFMLTRSLVIFDNLRHTVKIVACPYLGDFGNARRAYQEAAERIDAIHQVLKRSAEGPVMPAEAPDGEELFSGVESNFSRDDFCRIVRQARDYIYAGDCIQVVLSQRFRVEDPAASTASIYRALRAINPSPYLFYLKMGDDVLLGSSPEVMVRVERGVAELRPIAGTRPRGGDGEEDRRMEAELAADPKEKAEHVMLVDLARNDLSRVARPGTVTVDEFMKVERYSHVMHLVSSVTADLRDGVEAFDVLRATFPAGTLSGAPKIRAMEIIEELEGIRRGPYGGAVGYFGFQGNMDMCITIRSAYIRGGDAYVQAGAGIVADSVPEKEYQETKNKAAAVIKAIKMAERGERGAPGDR